MGKAGFDVPTSIIRGATCALVLALMSWSARAAAQPQSPSDGPVAEPKAAPPPEATPTAPAEEPPRAEFPGVTQGGVVTGTVDRFQRPWPTQRHFALVATEGSFNGFGLGIRAGSLRMGLDASFTFSPVFTTFTTNPEEFPEFKLLWGLQTNATTYFGLHRLDARTDLGIAFGYKYSTLLHHGGTVAFYFQRELGAHWALQVFIGPCIYPDAENQIRKETGWRAGSVSSGMAWHQAGLSASIAFFP